MSPLASPFVFSYRATSGLKFLLTSHTLSPCRMRCFLAGSALAVVMALGPSLGGFKGEVFAQTADADPTLSDLRGGLDGEPPLRDDNLDGIDDRTQPDVVRAPSDVSFDEPIEDADGGALGDDNRRSNTDNADGRQRGRLPTDAARARGQLSAQPTTAATPESEGNQRVRRAQPVGEPGADGEITPLVNQAVAPIEGRRGTPDDDPYAALGIRTGSFDWFPVLTQTLGYTSNADAAANGQPSVFSQTQAEVSVRSNWSLHELRGQVSLGYQTFFSDDTNDVPTLNASTEYRHDLSREWLVRLGGSYGLTTESPSSDNLLLPATATISERPFVHSGGAFAQVERTGGRLNLRLRGSFDRQSFGDVETNGFGTITQDDRNNTLYLLTARVGYEVSPAIQPFLEASVGTRQFDEAVDRNGNERSSIIGALRGGLAVDFGEKWSGEASVGYRFEDFDDAALSTLAGLTVDGSLVWSPRRLTTITATGSTDFSTATAANENGSITYTGQLQWVYDLRPHLSLNASVLGSLRQFDSTGVDETTLQAQAGFEWRFNRNLALIGNVGYETVDSSNAGEDYDAFTARAGLRWQQ
ncbi:MAG: outer membrane beta-barrel protein [Pseudomonadota bacterium]